MREYQCTINCSVCFWWMAITIRRQFPITREYLRENVRDGRYLTFEAAKKSRDVRKKRETDRQREGGREKGDDRYPIITEDRLAWPKNSPRKATSPSIGLSRIENCTPGQAIQLVFNERDPAK